MNDKILFRPRARDDLEAHARWIARMSIERASTFLDRCEQTLHHLLDFPELGASRGWLTPPCQGLRFHPVSGSPNHLIFYRTLETGLEVVRILHTARDIGNILSGES